MPDLPTGPPAGFTGAQPPGRATLPGDRVTLRPLQAADAPELFRVSHPPVGDPNTFTYLPIGPFASVSEMERDLAGRERSQDPLYFSVVLDGQPSGVVSYLRITGEHGTIEIGHIWFGAPLRRTPAATETIYLLARHAFDELGYRRLEWKCDALNAASRRAAERFGFTFEGVFRQHQVIKGRNRDTAWFSITNREWPAIRRGFEGWLAGANFDSTGNQRCTLGELIAAARGSP